MYNIKIHVYCLCLCICVHTNSFCRLFRCCCCCCFKHIPLAHTHTQSLTCTWLSSHKYIQIKKKCTLPHYKMFTFIDVFFLLFGSVRFVCSINLFSKSQITNKTKNQYSRNIKTTTNTLTHIQTDVYVFFDMKLLSLYYTELKKKN